MKTINRPNDSAPHSMNGVFRDGSAIKVPLPSLEDIRIVNLRDIIRCESSGSYTLFHLIGPETCVSTRNLGEFDAILQPLNFIRVHHSHLVNLAHVNRYVRGKGGTLEMSDGTFIEVSVRRRVDFMKRLQL